MHRSALSSLSLGGELSIGTTCSLLHPVSMPQRQDLHVGRPILSGPVCDWSGESMSDDNTDPSKGASFLQKETLCSIVFIR